MLVYASMDLDFHSRSWTHKYLLTATLTFEITTAFDGPEESSHFRTLKWDNFWSRMARRTFDGAFESWDFILSHGRTFRIVRTPREELRALEGIWYFSKKWHIHIKCSKYQHEHRFSDVFLHILGFGTYWRWNKHYNTISWPIPADFKIWNFLAKKNFPGNLDFLMKF